MPASPATPTNSRPPLLLLHRLRPDHAVDQTLARILTWQFQQLGYPTTATARASDALRILEADPRPHLVVVTNLTTHLEASAFLREVNRRPELRARLRVLGTTAASIHEYRRELSVGPIDELIEVPYDSLKLRARLAVLEIQLRDIS